ncbi:MULTISPECIES: hypothetical protein [Fischerella]|nr:MULTISPECIES: hypothetical protein [Fischerella]MBD2433062.1 hypothetical protein [Fischerella sp. FACHB-380]
MRILTSLQRLHPLEQFPVWGMMVQPEQHFIMMVIPHHEGDRNYID